MRIYYLRSDALEYIMTVSDLMTTKPHLIAEHASVLDAATKMQMTGCGILPVGKYEKIVGVITDRDIITRVIAEGKDYNKTTVKNAMSRNIFICFESDSLKKAVHKMRQHRTRRILVLNKDEKLTGILSVTDIIRRIKDKAILAILFAE